MVTGNFKECLATSIMGIKIIKKMTLFTVHYVIKVL